jgi:hypothetical protein
MMEPKVLIIYFIIHGAVGRGRDKIDITRKRVLLGIKEFNHEFMGFVEVLPVHLNLNGRGMVLLVTFADGDAVRNEVDFEFWGLLLKSALNNGVDGVTAVEGG